MLPARTASRVSLPGQAVNHSLQGFSSYRRWETILLVKKISLLAYIHQKVADKIDVGCEI